MVFLALSTKWMQKKRGSALWKLEYADDIVKIKGFMHRRENLQMENFFLGEYIKQRREALGLTQRQVCEGICTPVTLSRIENGTQTPSRTRINAILQRLGLPDDRYISLLSKNELKIEALKKEIVACNGTERVAEGYEKLAELEKMEEAADPLVQQFILRSRVLLGSLDGSCPPEKRIELLLKAIRLTVPDFELDRVEQYLYTKDEIKIINQIGNAFSRAGENEKAAVLYEQLLRYVREHHQETITSVGALPLVLYNYARVLDLCGRYEEGAALAREGQEACIGYGHYQYLPNCIEIEAECCHFLGQDEKSVELYHQAYYLCKAIRYEVGLQVVIQEAKEYLNLEFKF